jgi:hypothetical protein
MQNFLQVIEDLDLLPRSIGVWRKAGIWRLLLLALYKGLN